MLDKDTPSAPDTMSQEQADASQALFTISLPDVTVISSEGRTVKTPRAVISAQGIQIFDAHEPATTELMRQALAILPAILEREERRQERADDAKGFCIEDARATLISAILHGDDDEVAHAGDTIGFLAEWLEARSMDVPEDIRGPFTLDQIKAMAEDKTDWDRMAREGDYDGPPDEDEPKGGWDWDNARLVIPTGSAETINTPEGEDLPDEFWDEAKRGVHAKGPDLSAFSLTLHGKTAEEVDRMMRDAYVAGTSYFRVTCEPGIYPKIEAVDPRDMAPDAERRRELAEGIAAERKRAQADTRRG